MKRTGNEIELPKAKRTCNNINIEESDFDKDHKVNKIIITNNTSPNIPYDPEVLENIMKCKFITKFVN